MIKDISQSGIALIQILLVTALMSVLGLYFLNSSKQQIELAMLSQNKAKAIVENHSVESEVLFKLLTESKSVRQFDGEANNIWNFYDQPISITPNTEISMQDLNGFISVHFPNREHLESLLLSKGYELTSVNQVVDTFLDWQDLDNEQRLNGAENLFYGGENSIRNAPITIQDEFNLINSIDPSIRKVLEENTSIYRVGALSLFNASIDIIAALSSPEAAFQIKNLRELGQINYELFQQISLLTETDNMFYFTSNNIRITISSQFNGAKAERYLIVRLDRYSEKGQPFDILVDSEIAY